ncbi:hypothetical protein [Falsibacillus pallidus]|uniref:hypothetical protein n=1 Tax=Falsibacillus pallidus TaxID=493781 RepID=UPI003D9740F4
MRNIILLLFGLIFGISKLIYDHRVSAILMGLVFVIGSLLLFIKEIKQINSVNVDTTRVEKDLKVKKYNIFIIFIGLLYIWTFGLYDLFYKNDEVMVLIIPVFSYLILRNFPKIEHKNNGL